MLYKIQVVGKFECFFLTLYNRVENRHGKSALEQLKANIIGKNTLMGTPKNYKFKIF